LTATGNLGNGRYGHTATLVASGKVLVAGGYNLGELKSAELYDPAIGTWVATGSLRTPRSGHTAVLLPSGKTKASLWIRPRFNRLDAVPKRGAQCVMGAWSNPRRSWWCNSWLN